MKRNLVFRIGAVATSALLATAYVYDRSGGNLLPRFDWGAPAVPQEAATHDAMATPASRHGPAGMYSSNMYSSKSGIVFAPPELSPTATPTQLMPGSKSIILVEPGSAAPPQIEPQAEPPPAEASPSKPSLFGGSKSSAVFAPPADAFPVQAPSQQAAPR